MLYLAAAADTKASELRSESRRGFDMGQDKAVAAAMYIDEGLRRGLSPYEISIAYADKLDISESTMYRLVDAGVGGLANIQLERKVAFKPRRHTTARPSTSHAKKRSYKAFCMLDEQRKATASEMDTVEGRRCDSQCVLTFYQRSLHFQIPVLLPQQTDECVKEALHHLKSLCPPKVWAKLTFTVLTDNGGEFCDEEGIDLLFGGGKGDPHLFYCDPGRSDQKGRCEKNHSELRQLLPKGKTPFDELDPWDMAVVASHINSNPRKALLGMSPIQMFKAVFKEEGCRFLDALGIEEVPLDKLVLKPQIIDAEREKRGLPPINWLK
jgi:IS30 family transposase